MTKVFNPKFRCLMKISFADSYFSRLGWRNPSAVRLLFRCCYPPWKLTLQWKITIFNRRRIIIRGLLKSLKLCGKVCFPSKKTMGFRRPEISISAGSSSERMMIFQGIEQEPPATLHSLELTGTVRTCQVAPGPKRKLSFQPSIVKCELLVLGKGKS